MLSPVAPLGLWYLVYAACYKHAAPLGLKCSANLRHGIHRRGLVSSPDGLGDPPPTGLTVRYAITCRPSGALGYLVYAACYKHVAPLGLSAANSRHGLHRRGLVSSPAGWGTQPLRIPISHSHVSPSDHYIKKPLINQPHRDNITGIRKGVLTFCLSPIRQVL